MEIDVYHDNRAIFVCARARTQHYRESKYKEQFIWYFRKINQVQKREENKGAAEREREREYSIQRILSL
jgi:hypothetical protein